MLSAHGQKQSYFIFTLDIIGFSSLCKVFLMDDNMKAAHSLPTCMGKTFDYKGGV